MVIVPVLSENEPVVEFAATVTDAGAVSPVSPVLLKLTEMLELEALDNVTVQLLVAFDASVVGLHCSEETVGVAGGTRATTKDFDDPFAVAVTVAFWLLLTALTLAVKFALVDPAGTVTLAGTVKFPLLLEIATLAPPVGAAEPKVTVQVEDPAPDIEAGLQDSEDTWYEAGGPAVVIVPLLPERV